MNGSKANDPGAGAHNTITFAAGVTGTITLGNGLTLTRDVAITGPGARVLTVTNPADRSIFAVNAEVTVSISGLTSSGAAFADIENKGTLTVTESTLNSTSTDSIFNNGTLTVTSSTFSGNSVGIGNVQRNALTLRNRIVAGNTVANIQGAFTDGGHNLTSGDPKLGPLADNSVPTDTFLLLPELPHERRRFEQVFASPIMSPDADALPREGRKGECFDEFSGQTRTARTCCTAVSERPAVAEVRHPR